MFCHLVIVHFHFTDAQCEPTCELVFIVPVLKLQSCMSKISENTTITSSRKPSYFECESMASHLVIQLFMSRKIKLKNRFYI